jgi:cation transport protein ChaC
VHALCYVVDRGHRQYAGQLSLANQLHFARQGHGRSGACRDYVLAAVKELQTLGIKDIELQVLAKRLKGAHESSSR